MKLSSIYILVLVCLALVTMGWQCEKGDYIQAKMDYQFSEKLTLTPYKKIYSLNDTIWVEFQTANKSLFDKLTSSRIPTDTTFLDMTFYYNRRYPIVAAAEFFSYAHVDNGVDVSFTTLYTRYNVLKFKTSCSDNRYFFRAAFVPKKVGVYSIERGISFSNCPNKLISQNATFVELPFDLADCNKDIWLSIPPEARSGDTQTAGSIDRKEIFMFKVE